MRFDGEWIQCDDGIVRPVIRAEILAGEGRWRGFELLVDTGADRTVISANVLESLTIETTAPQDRIAGVGGPVDSVSVNTQIRLSRDDGQKAVFRGDYAACRDHEALDMSVLGRDILEMFALIVDRRTDLVAMIGDPHSYTIAFRAAES
jgi:predicted aspartyl protease